MLTLFLLGALLALIMFARLLYWDKIQAVTATPTAPRPWVRKTLKGTVWVAGIGLIAFIAWWGYGWVASLVKSVDGTSITMPEFSTIGVWEWLVNLTPEKVEGAIDSLLQLVLTKGAVWGYALRVPLIIIACGILLRQMYKRPKVRSWVLGIGLVLVGIYIFKSTVDAVNNKLVRGGNNPAHTVNVTPEDNGREIGPFIFGKKPRMVDMGDGVCLFMNKNRAKLVLVKTDGPLNDSRKVWFKSRDGSRVEATFTLYPYSDKRCDSLK